MASKIRYFIAAIGGDFAWPDRPVSLVYMGDAFQLRPADARASPNIVLLVPPGSFGDDERIPEFDACAALVSRLLSALAWAYGAGMRIDHACMSTNVMPVGVAHATIVQDVPPGFWLFESTTAEQRRALGSYREARAADANPPMAFLWFFRAIEAACGGYKSPVLSPYIDQWQGRLDGAALARWRAVASGVSLGTYLLDKRRNTIAHAAWAGTHDADDVAAVRVIADDLVLVERVAALAMSETLGITTFSQMVHEGRDRPPHVGWVPLERVE